MTQQLLVGYGQAGFGVEMTGPEGPVRGILGVGAAGPVGQLLLFNTITAGAAGSGRLVDIPTAQLTALPTGTLAYTGNSSGTQPSVHAYWRLLNPAPSTVSSDSITVLKPLGGASRIVWVRLPDAPDAYWAQRLAGVLTVDSIAGSDENFGNVAAPLATEAEAVRRIGPSISADFVFQPGGSSSGGRVFSDWSLLVQAAALAPGPKTIWFDDSLGLCNIPVGAWDLGPACTFRGITPNRQGVASNRVEVACPDGVTFTTVIDRIRDIRLTYSGTHSLMTIPADGRDYHTFLEGWARLNITGAGGIMFDCPAGSIHELTVNDFSIIQVSGGGFLARIGNGGEFDPTVNTDDANANPFPANCLSGVAGAICAAVAMTFGQINVTQAGMPGGVITVAPKINNTTFLVAYTPTTPADWVAPAPTTITNAIDRLAAAGGVHPVP
jgi:hypothetical protein